MPCKLSTIGYTSEQIVGIHMMLSKIISLGRNTCFNYTLVPQCSMGFLWGGTIKYATIVRPGPCSLSPGICRRRWSRIWARVTPLTFPCVSPPSDMSWIAVLLDETGCTLNDLRELVNDGRPSSLTWRYTYSLLLQWLVHVCEMYLALLLLYPNSGVLQIFQVRQQPDGDWQQYLYPLGSLSWLETATEAAVGEVQALFDPQHLV